MINETSIIEIKKSINWLFIRTTSLSYMLLSREMTFKSLCRGVFNFDINMNNTFLKKSYDISNTALIMALQTIFTTNSPIFIHFGCFRWLAGLWSLALPLSSDAMCSICFLFNNIIDRLFDFLDPRVSIVIIIVIITLDIIFIMSSSLFMLVTSIIIVLLLRYQVPGVMDIISA